jgi:hypothetical protein
VRLYFALDDYAGSSGRAWPHQSTVAERIGASVRSVQLWLKELVDAGFVTSRRSIRGNRYRLAWLMAGAAVDCGTVPQPVAAGSELVPPASQEPVPSDATERTAAQCAPRTTAAAELASAAERDAIRRNLLEFVPMMSAAEDNIPWDIEQTIDGLVVAGLRIGLTPFAVAAFLDRLYRRVARRRSCWPQGPRWFRRCMDNEYSPSGPENRPAPPRSNHARHWAGSSPSPEVLTQVSEFADSGFTRDLLAAAVAGVGRIGIRRDTQRVGVEVTPRGVSSGSR